MNDTLTDTLLRWVAIEEELMRMPFFPFMFSRAAHRLRRERAVLEVRLYSIGTALYAATEARKEVPRG